MESTYEDVNRAFMLDGNAVAGILNEIFALEMTTNQVECVQCGREGEIGTLLAFTQSPGIVLRCPRCENIIMRIVQSPEAIYLDLRGAQYVSLKRVTAS
jgi:Zn finger protein HypA/HybF involved in hydrogenase expression